jgi:hypothetical protein
MPSTGTNNEAGAPPSEESDPRVLRARARELAHEVERLLSLAERLEVERSAQPAAEDLVDRVNVERVLRISARVFLDAARRQEFPAYRAGRRLVARRSDVEAWLRSRPFRPSARRRSAAPASTQSSSEIDVSAALEATAARILAPARRSA